MKAADIADADILAVIDALQRERAEELGMLDDLPWTHTWDVQERYPDVPPKVVAAKLSKLLRRRLVTGCDCGCRGDWELTARGSALLIP